MTCAPANLHIVCGLLRQCPPEPWQAIIVAALATWIAVLAIPQCGKLTNLLLDCQTGIHILYICTCILMHGHGNYIIYRPDKCACNAQCFIVNFLWSCVSVCECMCVCCVCVCMCSPPSLSLCVCVCVLKSYHITLCYNYIFECTMCQSTLGHHCPMQHNHIVSFM